MLAVKNFIVKGECGDALSAEVAVKYCGLLILTNGHYP